MSTDLTNNIMLVATNNMTNSYSSSTTALTDADAFSSVLDNASKSYVDSTENKSVVNSAKDKNVAQKTKDIDSVKKQSDNESPVAATENNKKNADDKISKDKPQQTENKDESIAEGELVDSNNINNTQNTENNDSESPMADGIGDLDLSQNEINNSNVQNVNMVVSIEPVTVDAVDVSVADESLGENTLKQNGKQNVIANEQIIANIEYSDVADIEAALKEQIPEIDEKTLKTIVNEVKKTESAKAEQPLNIQNSEKNLVSDISVLKKDIVEVVKNTLESNTQIQTQDSKSSVLNDISRLTSGIEEVVVEPETDLKVITPSDTEADTEPVIKVVQEAVISANTRETATNGLENRDTVSKIKDKAVSQMTKLQDTDTVVTQSTVVDSGDSQQETLSQNNAQEQVIKATVNEDSTVINSSTSTDSFASRLESQISSKTSFANNQTLNSNDIMSQVNAKFEQLAQTGTNKVSIVLQPENLGRVSVEIMSTKEGVVAKMLTDNQQVKDLFDKSIDALKNNLSAQGVNVNSIKVECTQESANNAMDFEREQFNQAFDNQQNSSHHQQANQSDTTAQSAYSQDAMDVENIEIEATDNYEIKNTDTIIKHNGKVDYTV